MDLSYESPKYTMQHAKSGNPIDQLKVDEMHRKSARSAIAWSTLFAEASDTCPFDPLVTASTYFCCVSGGVGRVLLTAPAVEK